MNKSFIYLTFLFSYPAKIFSIIILWKYKVSIIIPRKKNLLGKKYNSIFKTVLYIFVIIKK